MGGKYCLFTEHVPAEFLATYLRKEDTSGGGAAVYTYDFPSYSRIYSVAATATPEAGTLKDESVSNTSGAAPIRNHIMGCNWFGSHLLLNAMIGFVLLML